MTKPILCFWHKEDGSRCPFKASWSAHFTYLGITKTLYYCGIHKRIEKRMERWMQIKTLGALNTRASAVGSGFSRLQPPAEPEA